MATRRRALLVLAVAALIVVPAAISWACGPNRAIQLDRFTYPPGGTVTVTGANFFPDIPISIKMNGIPQASTTTSGTGNFSVSFSAPTAAGSYTIVADGVDPETGNALAGTGSPQTFTVAAATTPSTGGNTPATGNKPPVPGATPGTQPGRARQNGRNSTSGREPSRSRGGERSGAGRQFSRSGAGAGTGTGTGTGPVNTTEGVIQTAGRTAFAGSVTRKDRAAASSKTKAGSTSKARPANNTATADLWSGFASSKNPSLMPSTADSGVPAARTSTGVVAGLALLGVGLLALVGLGGLVAAGRRKGRAPAS